VDDFIDAAIEALPVGAAKFDREKAQAALARIRDLRRGVPDGPCPKLPTFHLGDVGSLRRSEIYGDDD
jgi:hypothetical protein